MTCWSLCVLVKLIYGIFYDILNTITLFLLIKQECHTDFYHNCLSIHMHVYSENICGAYAMCPYSFAPGIGTLRKEGGEAKSPMSGLEFLLCHCWVIS